MLGVCLGAALLAGCGRSSADRAATRGDTTAPGAARRDTTTRAETTYDSTSGGMTVTQSPPGGIARQDSLWRATLAKWEREKPQRLLLVDTVPRTYAYARDHVSMSSVWGMQILTPDRAQALSSNPAAANGAYLIITKGHVPHTTPNLNARP
ncbi:MAG: hypothetical protein ACREMU_05305 [Gemmatimonadaceae bacterium]